MVLFAAIAVSIGWHSHGATKTTVTFEMAPAAYAGITDQILGLERFDTFTEQQSENLAKRSYDPLLDSENQFSMLQFLLQDQKNIGEFLKDEAIGKGSQEVAQLHAKVSAIQDKKGPIRATLSISGFDGDDGEKRAQRLLTHVSTMVSTKVREALRVALSEYMSSIETQIAGIEIAGKEIQSQKIKELEQALAELGAQTDPSSQELTIVAASPFSEREPDRNNGVEVRAAITPGALKAQLVITRNITPYSAKLEDLKARRAVALSYAIEKIDIPVYRIIGINSGATRANLPLPVWLALGGIIGLVVSLTGMLFWNWMLKLTNEFRNAQRIGDDEEPQTGNDEWMGNVRSAATTNRAVHANSARIVFES